MPIERMDDYFASRVDVYDGHMLTEVNGAREGYVMMARLLPADIDSLLDLGCGTGLELDELFKTRPGLSVTGIDMTKEMLDRLRGKHPDKNMTLICASYFDVDFGDRQYDAAVSFETMHHFSREKKTGLYSRIQRALRDGGQYIECDYMITSREEEDFFFSENKRLRAEQGIPDGAFYHLDTPCTIDSQLAMFRAAGFSAAEMVWRQGNTTIIVAKK